MRRIAITVMVLVVGIALWKGLHPTTPARTADAYRHKAKDTAESVLSAVQTARLASRVGSDGDAFPPYVSVLLSESESAAAGAQGSFDRVQPPDARSDATRARLGRMLNRANDVLSRLRITARRGDMEHLARRAIPLGPLARRLEQFISHPAVAR
jgi:hypothetical protein